MALGSPPAPGGFDAASGAAAPGERQLLTAIERTARAPGGWSAVALHLSRLTSPAPRPHHRRVGRALLNDAALRADGQVFDFRNGDLVLLAHDGARPPGTVSEGLRRLFGRDAADPAAVVSEWQVPADGAALLAYAAECIAAPRAAAAEDVAAPPAVVVDAVAAAISGARPQTLLQRQTAVLVDPAGAGTGVQMRVCYQELTFSLDMLEARMDAPVRLAQDTALLLHLGRYLDQRMLQILLLEHGSLSPLDLRAHAGSTLHLNLSLPGVLSEEFAALAALCRADRRALGIEISLVEAVADLAAYARAGARLRELGALLVLDGVSYHALLLARPDALAADRLKLEWSPRLGELAADERGELARVLAAADPARVILHRAETEAAVRWGLAQRIRMFQGRHIDQMLAVQRMLGCRDAAACTLRQCGERATATGGVGRTSCTNLPLLDAGLPGAMAVAARG